MSLENPTIHLEDVNTSDNDANNHKREFIPVHWNVRYLGEICLDKPQNGAFIKNPQTGEGTLFVNVYDIYQNVILDIHTVERLRCDKSLIKTYSLRKNDLLFVRSSLKLEGIGQCCLVKEVEEPAIFDCHLIRISPDISRVDPPIGADFRKEGGEKRTTSLFCEKVQVSNDLSQEERCQHQFMIAKRSQGCKKSISMMQPGTR